MTLKTFTSLAAAALFGIGMLVAPSLASAKEPAVRVQPVDPAVIAAYGDDLPLLSSGGEVVTGNAWCDEISGICQMHPWTHSARHGARSK